MMLLAASSRACVTVPLALLAGMEEWSAVAESEAAAAAARPMLVAPPKMASVADTEAGLAASGTRFAAIALSPKPCRLNDLNGAPETGEATTEPLVEDPEAALAGGTPEPNPKPGLCCCGASFTKLAAIGAVEGPLADKLIVTALPVPHGLEGAAEGAADSVAAAFSPLPKLKLPAGKLGALGLPNRIPGDEEPLTPNMDDEVPKPANGPPGAAGVVEAPKIPPPSPPAVAGNVTLAGWPGVKVLSSDMPGFGGPCGLGTTPARRQVS